MSSQPATPGSDVDVIDFTDEAVAQAREALQEGSLDSEDAGLRIVARQTCDCGSLGYKMGLEEAPDEDDTVRTFDGVNVFLDPETRELVEGSTVDFVSDGGRSGFGVANPNVKGGGCGCGGGGGHGHGHGGGHHHHH